MLTINSPESSHACTAGVKRVIVVDDEPAIVMITSAFLTRLGYQVMKAYDGEECLRVLESSPADLVITDMHMHPMNGMKLMGEIQRRFPEVTLIAMSGAHTSQSLAKIRELYGPIGILHKPFDMDTLVSTMEGVMEGDFCPCGPMALQAE